MSIETRQHYRTFAQLQVQIPASRSCLNKPVVTHRAATVDMSLSPSQRLEVIVRQIHRGGASEDNTLPFHWAILFHEKENFREAHVYQVIGNIDTYMFDTIHVVNDFTKSEGYRGAVRVGTIHRNDIEKAEEIIKDIPVYRHRPDWSCQNWCLSALSRLKAAGLTTATKSETLLRDELTEQNNLWESGEDVYGE